MEELPGKRLSTSNWVPNTWRDRSVSEARHLLLGVFLSIGCLVAVTTVAYVTGHLPVLFFACMMLLLLMIAICVCRHTFPRAFPLWWASKQARKANRARELFAKSNLGRDRIVSDRSRSEVLNQLRFRLAKFDEEARKAEEDLKIRRTIYQLELDIATKITNAKLTGPAGLGEDAKRNQMAILEEKKTFSLSMELILKSPIPDDIKAQIIEKLAEGTYGNGKEEPQAGDGRRSKSGA